MSKRFIFITFPIILLIGIYFLGPSPDKPLWDKKMPVVPKDLDSLASYVENNEAKHKIKLDNQARIIWLDSTRKKTEYSVVYLHGFHASQEEGDPVHVQFAITFGCNLYLSRLADHGIDTTDAMINYTVDRSWASAKEALMIGKSLGSKVILMSTSTGGTMALALAAEFPDDVYALINLSPNVKINDPLAWIGNNHWGIQIGKMVKGESMYEAGEDSLYNQYWTNPYRIEAVAELEEMLESKMNEETFSKVKCPSLSLYYYKDEKEQDPTVAVQAIIEMNKLLGTPDSLKAAVSIPNAGDHVMGSYIKSKDLEGVQKEINKFAIEKLKLKPVIE